MAGRIAYYGNIVRDGLILDLDAAKRDSYPGTGTIWRDIAGGVITGSLINGPTFDANNGGSIVFDGVDDYVTGNFLYTFNTGWSVEIWVYIDSRVSYPDDEGIFRISSDNNNRINLRRTNVSTNSWRYEVTGPNGTTGTSGMQFNAITDGVWSQIICTSDGNDSLKVYHNNTLVQIGVFNIGNVSVSTYNIGVNFSSPYLQGDVAIFRIYNRELSAAEVTQNYNATKTRFGL